MTTQTQLFSRDRQPPQDCNSTAAGPIWRAVGLIYVAMALPLGLAGAFVAASGANTNYHVPHACECLECRHPIAQSPDGRSYCSVHPPRDIKLAQVSPSYVRFSQVTVRIMGALALASAAASLTAGGLWLAGRAPIPGSRLRRINICAASPLVAIAALIAALIFMFPYGYAPM